MKKLYVIIAVAGLMFVKNATAQTKIGYIRIDDIVGLMPELAQDKVTMDTVGLQFIKDSVQPQIAYKQSEYQRKLDEYKDSTKPKGVRDQILKDLQQLQEELSGVDNYVQQVQQAKQQEFLRPYYAKAKKAIEQVAKEKGYTHILSTDIFLVAPEADDISLLVLARLGIKLPEQNIPKTNPTNKPATNKPNVKTGN